MATLFTTGLVGVGIGMTPTQTDVKLSVIEQAMQADTWAICLAAVGFLGFFCELWMWWRKNEKLLSVVSSCHILACGILVGYSASALVAVFLRIPWNFSAPALGLLMALWHLMYVKRKVPHIDPGVSPRLTKRGDLL